MKNKKKKFSLENMDIDFFESGDEIEEIVVDEDDELSKRVKEFVELDYPIKLTKDQDESGPYWLAEHPDLPGCKAHGDTKEDALKNLEDARISWMYSYADLGKEIPKPNQLNEVENCSGKILLRVPKELHYSLINKAKVDGISLNQEILYLLSSSFGNSQSVEYFHQILEKLDMMQNKNENNNWIEYNHTLASINDLINNSVKKINKNKSISFETIINEAFDKVDKGKHKFDFEDYNKFFIQ